MKLLLVEDERKLLDALSYLLAKSGYMVDTAIDGEQGIELAITEEYDVIILDRMLPKLDGIAFIKEFRSLGFDTPILFLTAKDAPQDRVDGLDAGADDYLTKPFFTEELLARLRALNRRKDKQFMEATISAGGLTLCPLRSEVTIDGKNVHLTVKESLLLELLMRNFGHVITKECIMEKVWGYNSDTDMANVDLYIHYLRKKLNGTTIKTVRGIGYIFQGDINVS